jgi:hypothetical protein
MTFLKKNIYHLAGLLLIVILFVLSVFIRKENHSVPLSRHHEWITAHTLITCEIWAENGGPSAYHFSPVYTYPGEGNAGRHMLGGVEDEKGDVYYVSYPPFSFLFAYYATQFMGGPDTDSIRSLNLSIHLLCALLLYLIAVSLAIEKNKNYFSIAGVTAAFLYLFSTGNLWIHGNLYFADMLAQLFIIAGIYLTIRFFKKNYRKEMLFLSALATIFFLATYTEWLGLFLSFFIGMAFLAGYFIKKEKRFLKAFFSVGIASALALALTLMQYASIAGWDQFKEVSTSKYEDRSGRKSMEETPAGFTLENEDAYRFLVKRVDVFYKMAENFVGISAIIFVLVFLIFKIRKGKRNANVPVVGDAPDRYRDNRVPTEGSFPANNQNTVIAMLVTVLLILSVLVHYFLFFNFNALHDFSSLKTGFVFVLIVLVFLVLAEAKMNLGWRIVLFAVITILCIDKGRESIQRYRETFPLAETDWDRISTGAVMKKYGRPEAAVFMNIPSNPELVYAAHHNVFPLMDTTELHKMMVYYGNDKGQYYHHQGTKLEYILEFEMQNDRLVFLNRVAVGSDGGYSGTTHQK